MVFLRHVAGCPPWRRAARRALSAWGGPSIPVPLTMTLVRAALLVARRPRQRAAALEGLRGHSVDERLLAAWEAALDEAQLAQLGRPRSRADERVQGGRRSNSRRRRRGKSANAGSC